MSLHELLERVKAASGPDREIDMAIAREFDLFETLMGDRRFVRPFYFTASIDAAVALIERVLPGCRVELLISEDGSGHVTLRLGSEDTGPLSYWGAAPTPPLALIIAPLEAKIAEDKP